MVLFFMMPNAMAAFLCRVVWPAAAVFGPTFFSKVEFQPSFFRGKQGSARLARMTPFLNERAQKLGETHPT
jgi:hypothetical protein